MTFFSTCGHCGCTRAGTAVFCCPACQLLFCERCGLALSVNTFTYCPRCASMKHRDTALAGYIGAPDDPA